MELMSDAPMFSPSVEKESISYKIESKTCYFSFLSRRTNSLLIKPFLFQGAQSSFSCSKSGVVFPFTKHSLLVRNTTFSRNYASLHNHRSAHILGNYSKIPVVTLLFGLFMTEQHLLSSGNAPSQHKGQLRVVTPISSPLKLDSTNFCGYKS